MTDLRSLMEATERAKEAEKESGAGEEHGGEDDGSLLGEDGENDEEDEGGPRAGRSTAAKAKAKAAGKEKTPA